LLLLELEDLLNQEDPEEGLLLLELVRLELELPHRLLELLGRDMVLLLRLENHDDRPLLPLLLLRLELLELLLPDILELLER